MSANGVDVTGYPLERARQLLAEAGIEVGEARRIGPVAEGCEGQRVFVVRQRTNEDGTAALVVAGEWKAPTEREVACEQR